MIRLRELKHKIKRYVKENKDKKIVVLGIIAAVFFIISIYLYKDTNNGEIEKNVMENIFVEENTNAIEEKDSGEISTVEVFKAEKQQEKKKIVVEIKGEVKNPDVYYLEEGAIVKDLIDKAGGPTEEANLDSINRALTLKDGACIIINNKNQDNANSNSMINLNDISKGSDKMDSLININTATLEELKTLKGIGEAKAQDIIDYREKNNGFKTIDELKNVKGIGEKTFENLKDSIST